MTQAASEGDDPVVGTSQTTNAPDSLKADLLTLVTTQVSLDPSAPIGTDTDLLLTGLVDSLGVVQIVGWIEDRVGTEIDPGDVVLENFQTVNDMVSFVGRLQLGDE